MDDVVRLARALIAIDNDNPPGAELGAAECVGDHLAAHGIDAQLQPFGDGRANLVARVPGAGRRRALVLSGHLDTVPAGTDRWTHGARAGAVEDGRLYGRGAVDMKGSVAAMTVALCEVHAAGTVPEGDVVLALTASEETDSEGARVLVESGLIDDAGAAVIGEPTNFDVGIAHRGALWVRAVAAGERGHGSRPSREKNAICRLLDWLGPLEEIEALVADREDPLLGSGTASLNMIDGGDAVNVIPDGASATIDLRTVPGHDHAALLDALRGRSGDVTVSVLRDAPPVSAREDSALVTTVVAAVSSVLERPARIRGLPYVTDASVLCSGLGIPAVVVGPGQELQAHTVDEFIEISALYEAMRLYRRIAESSPFPTPSA